MQFHPDPRCSSCKLNRSLRQDCLEALMLFQSDPLMFFLQTLCVLYSGLLKGTSACLGPAKLHSYTNHS